MKKNQKSQKTIHSKAKVSFGSLRELEKLKRSGVGYVYGGAKKKKRKSREKQLKEEEESKKQEKDKKQSKEEYKLNKKD